MAIKAFRCNFFILVIFVTIFCLIALQSSVHPTPQQMRILFADFNASNADVGNSLKFHLLTDEIGYMTAYYDNRTHKVVLLGKAWIKPDKSGQPTIYCILHYENQHQPTVVRMEFFTTYIYYCALASKEIPDAVALVFRSDSANSSIPVDLIRVRKLPIPGPTGKFAVCGPTLMRKYADWIKFVQWVEWYLLMGAERIFLYDYEATATVENLVNHYVNQNIIELMRWPQEKLCVDRDYFCQLARINDCVHRTRYRYKFVTIVDVDELIYPQFHTNLTAIFDHYRILSKIALPQDFHLNLDFSNRNLLGALFKRIRYYTPKVGCFEFQVCWLPWEDQVAPIPIESYQLVKYLPLTAVQNRTECAEHGDSSKTVIVPERIIKEWVHFPNVLEAGAQHLQIPAELGNVRHYKKFPQERIGYKTSIVPASNQLQLQLLLNVEKRLRNAGSFLSN